jgi:ribosome-associated translation inhibitor RaiA
VDVIFHSHHAPVSERMRRRAQLAAERAATRLARAVDAIVRFEQDGPVKRVEIVLHAPRQRDIVALGEDRFYGRALTTAIDKLSAQVRKIGRARKSGNRKRAAAANQARNRRAAAGETVGGLRV